MRARNMQSLTEAIRRRHPGVVIYGIGDDAHKLHSSDHNEDDTTGSKSAQSDSDSTPEHRAIDVMLGPSFSKEDADKLVDDLVSDPASRDRLFNIIWNGYIWSRSWGWTRRAFGGDPHRDHPHIAGLAADDENAAGWPAVDGGSGGLILFCKSGEKGSVVQFLQYRLRALGFDVGPIDSDFGPRVAAALKAACQAAYSNYSWSGESYGPAEMIYVDTLWARKYAGRDGAPGRDGKDGRDGMLLLPESVTIEALVRPAE